ncbi:MAG: hypothetical protein AAGK97_19090, partial [Bacteroidota bacterium]
MKILCKGLLISSFLFLITPFFLNANNIQVSNISLTGLDENNGTVLIEFDLSWENSWRLSVGPANYDAAWIFVKFRRNNGNWGHAYLNYVNGTAAGDGHTAPAGSIIYTASDSTGCFIYRDTDGSGNVNYNDVQLQWNYLNAGVNQDDILDIQ